MYAVSNNYKTIAKSKAPIWKSYFTIVEDSVDISGDNYLQKWTLKDYVYDKNDGTLIGNTIAKMLELQMINTFDYELENKEISLYSGVVLNPTADEDDWTTEYVPHGKFIVQPVENKEVPAQQRFIAYDYMIKFNIQFSVGDLTYPTTALLLLQHICTLAGVTLATSSFTNDDFVITAGDAFPDYTCRQVLSSICKLTGTTAHINRSNQLALLDFGATNVETIDGNHYITFEKNKVWGELNELVLNSYDIDGENVTESDAESIAEHGLTPVNIQEQLIIYTQDLRTTAITDLWAKLFGITYTPFVSKTKPFNYLDPLDLITIKDLTDTSYTTYVFNQTIIFDFGAMYNEIETPALTLSEVELKFKNPEVLSTQKTEILVNKHERTIVLKSTIDGSLVLVELGADATLGSTFHVVADNITLEGYISANGAFAIDEYGNVYLGGILSGAMYNLLPNSSGLEDLDKWTISHTWNSAPGDYSGVKVCIVSESLAWSAGSYFIGDLCSYDGNIYMCNSNAYQSTSFEANISKWDEIFVYEEFDAGNYYMLVSRLSWQPSGGEYMLSDEIAVDGSSTYNFSAKTNCQPEYDIYESTTYYHNYHIQILESYSETFSIDKTTELFVRTELFSEGWQNISKSFVTDSQTVKLKIKIINGNAAVTDDDWNRSNFLIADILLDKHSSQRDWTFNADDEIKGTTQISSSSFKVFDIDNETELIKINKGGIYSANKIKTDSSIMFEESINDVTKTELSYLEGVTSAVQTQLNDKLSKASGGTVAGNVTLSGLTASQLVSTNASKVLTSLATATYPSLTELAYVKGLTSAVQTQLNDKLSKASGGTVAGNVVFQGSTDIDELILRDNDICYQVYAGTTTANWVTVFTLPNIAYISGWIEMYSWENDYVNQQYKRVLFLHASATTWTVQNSGDIIYQGNTYARPDLQIINGGHVQIKWATGAGAGYYKIRAHIFRP